MVIHSRLIAVVRRASHVVGRGDAPAARIVGVGPAAVPQGMVGGDRAAGVRCGDAQRVAAQDGVGQAQGKVAHLYARSVVVGDGVVAQTAAAVAIEQQAVTARTGVIGADDVVGHSDAVARREINGSTAAVDRLVIQDYVALHQHVVGV